MITLSRTAILANTSMQAIGFILNAVVKPSIHAVEELAVRFLARTRLPCCVTRFFHLALVAPWIVLVDTIYPSVVIVTVTISLRVNPQ
jgi:hypothetical protein